MKTLTTGSPTTMIVRFTLPIFIGNILQQLYQTVDNMIVGQFVGADAFAAIGATYGLFFLLSGFIWGTTTGFTVLTAQTYGAGDLAATRRSIGTAAVLSAVLVLLMSGVSVAAMPLIFRLIRMPAELYADAYSYMTIICIGLAAQVFYNLTASVLRAVGNSKIPLYFLIVASVLNIGLDLLFILPFGWGVAGAAWATVLAQGVSGVLCFVYIWRRYPVLRLTKSDFVWHKEYAKKELSVGVPMALQYAITSVGMLMIQTAVNHLGTTAITAYSVGNKIEVILEQGPIAIGSAMATYTAQNRGAGEWGRVRQGVRSALGVMLVYAAVFGTLTATLGKHLTHLFLSENVAMVIGDVDVFLKIVSATIFLLGVLCVYRNCVQGLGYGTISMLGGVVELLARGAVAVAAIGFGEFWVACTGYPIAWLSASALFVIVYAVVIRRRFSQMC